MKDEELKQYLADSPPTVVNLAIKPHFDQLTREQKLYAHHISRAAFTGIRIILRQVSPEAESIYDLIIALYESCSGDWQRLQEETNLPRQDVRHFLEYAAQFLYNAGNYKGMGDSKFIPRLSPSAMASLVTTTPKAKKAYEAIGEAGLYVTSKPGLMHLGFPDQGHLSAYYPSSTAITPEEIATIGDFLATKGLLPENTRLCKLDDGSFKVLVAAGVQQPSSETSDVGGATSFRLDGPLAGKEVFISYGDHEEEMASIALHIKKAAKYAANETQKVMMEEYAKSFATGSMLAFKESQKKWVTDISPVVESNIGFIESYRDPAGVRAEWEGFVSIVNKERTRAFQKLVEAAPSMIPKLPWAADFEMDTFTAPDFTSLEVLSFASSAIPAGINIPNHEDIRRSIGFKNVSLGNVLSAKAPDEPIRFIHADDLEIFSANLDHAFEVQVGIHELLGHGTGKLLQEISPGKHNFPISSPPISPITKQPIETWYKPGQTWQSVFGAISSSYEECRAECVAMALACDFTILSIFGFGDGSADLDGPPGHVLHAAYLSMARAGIAALEFWDPASRKWGQAHMQARFSILQVFLDAGHGFCTLKHAAPDLSDLVVRIDRAKIVSVGRPAVERYLQQLHVYKCTADLVAGEALYTAKTTVGAFWADQVRPAVMALKLPRKVFVQANTAEQADGTVVLKEYEPTLEGMIQSFAERHV